MILTYKVRHHQDFSLQLRQAKQVAKFAIANRDKLSSKHVAHFGLKSAISNQILREYGRNKKCKTVSNIKLIVPSQAVKFSAGTVEVVCLGLKFPFDKTCEKINQIEVDREWLYVSVSVTDEPQYKVEGWVGIDRNTTGNCAVVACTKTNKVMFLGKKAQHVHNKYKNIRKKLQRLKKLKKLKTIKRRESNITKDLNHKISRKVVNYAKKHRCGIKLEKLEGIRQRTKQAKSFRYSLNSWAYYQLQQFVEYKAQIAGVPVVYIEPAYTSQTCHKCGQLGNRSGKAFKCTSCGYASHADGNASWNIAYSEKFLGEPKAEHCCTSASLQNSVYTQRLQQAGDCCKGTTDSPQLALA
ncbi:MAG: IS200/IS605 family element transposase accessory protein TnpB [Candidatus Competibacteraceae bacterium]|nr:IS200/IS605 family element transposase accessory protein TnpB [Candidatus Competibacteraceae bacterium]